MGEYNGHGLPHPDVLEQLPDAGPVPMPEPTRLTPEQIGAIREHEQRRHRIREVQCKAFELRAQEDAAREARESIEKHLRNEIAMLNAEESLLNAFLPK